MAVAANKLRPELEDPQLRGWALFFEFEALYSLGKHRDALTLFSETVGKYPDGEITQYKRGATPTLSKEEVKQIFIISDKNVAWMYSVALELTQLLDDEKAFWRIKPSALSVAARVRHIQTRSVAIST